MSAPTIIIIDYCVAQGSCLAPLVFIVYMSDIVRRSIEINFLVYANDTTLYVSGVDIGQCITIMNKSLSHVYRRLRMNKLSLNVSKTSYVIFNGRKKIDHNVLSSITLNKAALERKETVKILAVYLDEGLNFKFHVNYISKRIAKFPLFFLEPIDV